MEILPALRESLSLREVPVVGFTAHDSRRREALKQGVDDFLSRPFDARQLRSIVERTLSRGRPITPCSESTGS